jgi:hypothetical protein
VRKRSQKNNRFHGRSFPINRTILPSSKIEVDSDFIALLSAATQTKPEKTISDLYFYFLGEYKKLNPNSILFKRPTLEEKEEDTDNHRQFTFIYKVFSFKLAITATLLVSKYSILNKPDSDITKNLTIIFTQGRGHRRSKNYRKTFDIKYLEDKMFSEQLFG